MASLHAITHNFGNIFTAPTLWLLTPIIIFEAVAEARARRGSRRR
jgi:hypothetical protein